MSTTLATISPARAALYARALRHLTRRCPVMKAVVGRVGACTWAVEGGDPFTQLVRAVIAQQISYKAALSINARLVAAVGGPPIPLARLAAMTEADFKACGVSGPKQRTIRALCDHVGATPDLLPGIHDRGDDLIRAGLTAVKGIGPWTVDMFLMFGIARPDVWPTGDYGVRVAVRNVYGLKDVPTPAEVAKIGEPLKPYRSVAAWYLWRSLGATV